MGLTSAGCTTAVCLQQLCHTQSMTALQHPNTRPCSWKPDANQHVLLYAPALVMVVMQVGNTQRQVLLLKVVV